MTRLTFLGSLAAGGLALAMGCGDGGETAAEDDGGGGTGGTSVSSSSQSSSSSSGTGGSGAAGCFDYANFTPQQDVSFADDIMPIFAGSCNNNNCHGNPSNPDGGLYLGETGANNTAQVLAEVYADLVAVSAKRAPTMQRVIAGDAENSWLMIKLDGDMKCPQVSCGSQGCGLRMPRGTNAMQLPAAQRDLVRSWIANGAVGP